MKKEYIYISIIVNSLCFLSCNDIKEGPIDHDETAPGMVTDVKIIRQPGGATFTYTLPDDPDLLCVEASYHLADGMKKSIRSSYHSRSLSVKGFADTAEYMVNLTSIDRSENRSQPVNVIFRPLIPPVISAYETLNMKEDFGGIKLNWKNPGKVPLTVFISIPDSLGEEQIIRTCYSSSEKGEYSIEGLDTIAKNFTVRFRDKWNNYSKKKTKNLTPLFEVMLDRTKFKNMGSDYASASIGNVNNLGNLWDNDFVNHAMKQSKVPWFGSWDLGVKAHLSKIIIWQYAWPNYKNYGFYYAGDNMRRCKIYGTNTPDIPDSWIELQDCEIIKPSGLPLGYGREFMSDEDFDIAHNQGHKFSVPQDKPAIRYFRLESLEVWQAVLGTPSEIQIFGDPRQK